MKAKKVELEHYTAEIKGQRPLLVHAIPQEGFGERKRPGERRDPRDEAELALYKDAEGGIVIPAYNILSSLRIAAKEFRVPGKGRVSYSSFILSGLELTPPLIPLQGGDGTAPPWVVDIRPVVIQRARILRARPRFDEWRLGFGATILDPILRAETLKDILVSAGKYVGLCDFRPLYGLFTVERFERAG